MVFCRTDAIGGPFGSLNPLTFASLAFVRASRAQNSAGEIVTNWSATVTLSGSLQPRKSRFPRFVHGDVEEAQNIFVVMGNHDILVGDRCYVSAVQCEVDDVDNYGTAQMEIHLKWVR